MPCTGTQYSEKQVHERAIKFDAYRVQTPVVVKTTHLLWGSFFEVHGMSLKASYSYTLVPETYYGGIFDSIQGTRG
jgi:hypothetical protein